MEADVRCEESNSTSLLECTVRAGSGDSGSYSNDFNTKFKEKFMFCHCRCPGCWLWSCSRSYEPMLHTYFIIYTDYCRMTLHVIKWTNCFPLTGHREWMKKKKFILKGAYDLSTSSLPSPIMLPVINHAVVSWWDANVKLLLSPLSFMILI